MTRDELNRLDVELTCVGFPIPGHSQLGGPLNWRENLAYARVRAGSQERRYRVHAIKRQDRYWEWYALPIFNLSGV